VKNGRIVGRGYHAVFGGPHAEVQALKNTGKKARGSTAYVNLEPCCHTDKKTPPCVPALISAGVRRIVIGMMDPNPKVSGRGIRRLRQAGIRVESSALEAECKAFNRPFIVCMRKHRPYVILKAAASLDGRIATARGESKWITSPEARKASRRMRAQADAILIGIGTVLADDPSLTAHGEGRNPLRVVLDSRLRTPAQAKVMDGRADTLIFTAAKKRAFNISRRPGSPSIICVPRLAGGLNLRHVLRHLFNCGIGNLIVEGGGHVHTAFLEAGLVDEVRLFLAPLMIGGSKAASFFEGRGIARLKDALRLSEFRVHKIGPDLLLTGYLGKV
jgi:diaminohydroxyphosphoribosylaminopyrimidine deaminase/5-amino-6-(5-phosphoribosylamino)uracil reductase